jgi:hypothetical protein
MSSCTSFNDVESAVKSGRVVSHGELMYAVASALKCELLRRCKKSVVEYALQPMIERHLRARKRPDIRLGNLVIEVEAPGGGLDAGRSQLRQYMRELASMAPWLDAVYGVVTNGVDAEYYVLGRGGDPESKTRGNLGEVAAAALANFCAGKVPVVSPEDLVEVLGV